MYLDILIAIPLLWGMFRGFKRGLIIELCTLMALVLGIYGAIVFGDSARKFLENSYNTDPQISLVLAFALVFIVIVIAVFIFGKVLEKIINLVALGMINKIFGLVFGGIKFLLILSGIVFILNGIPLTQNIIPVKWKSESILYPIVRSVVHKISPLLDGVDFQYDLEKQIEQLKEKTLDI